VFSLRTEDGTVSVEFRTAGPIRGKKLGDVVLHAEKNTNCVVIFTPVQPPQRHCTRVVPCIASGLAEPVVAPGSHPQATVCGETTMFGNMRRGLTSGCSKYCVVANDIPPYRAILFWGSLERRLISIYLSLE
jgi:hypothetical protein